MNNPNYSAKQIDDWIAIVKKCQILYEKDIKIVASIAKEILEKEPNVLRLSPPMIVCGDLHGQFYDVMELFRIGGDVPDANYLFLGDYVDRGLYSVETITLLLLLKIRYPTKIYILRGNHESRQVTQTYGFYDECMRKYGNLTIWQIIVNVFDYLPLAAVINSDIFCLHAGLSPSITTITEISNIDRIQEIPVSGSMSDLLWSDPSDTEGWTPSPRGAGYIFGDNITVHFNYRNNIQYIARAHELVPTGYEWRHNHNLVTIFSAPNYCYRSGNQAAILTIDEHMNSSFIQFNAAPRDNKLDIFS